ncbi:MAG: glycosyltransferase family 25 protein [Cognatishimia sp.]|nr:glycosyltransferase family 25 protein [Cognatishimia sp.]
MSAPTKDTVRISVVSLKRATDRRALMAEEFAKAGLDYAFFDAVDARQEPERIAEYADRGPWGQLHAHDKACTQSHREALEAFVASDDTYCLMLEDDVFLASDLKDWLKDMSWWPSDADVVKLERWIDDKLVLVMGKKETEHLGRKVKPLLSRHSGCAGYLVTKESAAKLLAETGHCMPIDHLVFNTSMSPVARLLKIYQVTPALTVQGNLPSGTELVPASRPPAQKDLRKDLARAWYELKPIPRFLALLASGRAELAKVTWQDKTQNTQQAEIA